MSEKEVFYQIVHFENQWKEISADGNLAVISSNLVLRSSRAATLFISQEIDGIEMFEAARYAVAEGENHIELKDLKIIKPRTVASDGSVFQYNIGVRVFGAGLDEVVAGNSISLP